MRKYKMPEYNAWRAMVRRCDPGRSAIRDHRYVTAGIRVCARWHSFDRFLADMGERPSPKHSIDRIDNDGDYCPENCRWATRSQQQRNTSRTRQVTINGVTKHLAEWSEELGIDFRVLARRITRDGTGDLARLTRPVTRSRKGTRRFAERAST